MCFIVMDKVPGSDFFPTGTEFPGLIDPQFEPDTRDKEGIVKERKKADNICLNMLFLFSINQLLSLLKESN
ncbi:hypothetical protein AP064_04570 [Candidatus Liberibacter solanacearum]|uniref:Uncharacterized protein n=1 Tax=Candidatus Liberibacter solanacearum TaxID=556287 RepID=A0A0F4VJX7_9HYPH|nr:hypothetical protein [Candidatus Liberibacter solanacearum]KJZ81808.1 hypothetical protein DJ66_0535 [Candidatus Liberibacter solanacearum]KQC48864.1 hypothetical protein AP064_04570 [Candidatus Liberibacter solanacearum]